MKFYGRREELSALKKEIDICQQQSRMVVLTGRRRVGKTRLILEACQNSPLPYCYFFVQRRYTETVLAQEWLSVIRNLFGLSEDEGPAKLGLANVIRFAMKLSQTKPFIIVIDECQEIDHINKAFWSQLQQVWDWNKDTSHLLLAMSGSIAVAIRHIFCDASEPLFGRKDLALVIRPFQPSLIKEIFLDHNPNGTPEDLLTFYALTGGVARYIENLTTSSQLTKNAMLDYVCSPSGSVFRTDGNTVLANEFRLESSVYYQILRAIAAGKTQWSELQNVISDKQISPYIERLEKQYGLITKRNPLFSESRKGLRYHISDPYFRFWFRFIESSAMERLIESSQWDLLKKYCVQEFENFSGHTLETWFHQAFLESGQYTHLGYWWDRRGENKIDLVAINEFDKKLAFYEIKRNPKKIRLEILEKKSHAFLKANGSKFQKYEAPIIRGLSMNDMLTL